jgi:transposase InsO family protein
MSQRREFVMLASQEDSNVRQLCRRYGISPTTGYKWLRRACDPEAVFAERPRVPTHQPSRTPARIEALVLKVRDQHSAWGGRKIRRRLMDLGHAEVPSASTITAILKRHGRIDLKDAAERGAWQRFERQYPNELWQMDFKGHFEMTRGRCHPLTVLDDCSRFSLGLEACADERTKTVEAKLCAVFRRYGLPAAILADNGQPWGGWDHKSDQIRYTALAVWLIRLGIWLQHGRPYHPQTQGKDERFHRTLKAEVIGQQVFRDIDHCQRNFDNWRMTYNCERPHDALELDVPAKRYQPSARVFPEQLPPVAYGDPLVRRVQAKGEISFAGREWVVGKAFAGQPVAVRPTTKDGCYDIFFCHQQISTIDLADPS